MDCADATWPNTAAGRNYCENWQTGFPGRACSSGGNYSMHEDDTPPYASLGLYSAMRYTILNAPSVFIRSSDSSLSKRIYRKPAVGNKRADGSHDEPINHRAVIRVT